MKYILFFGLLIFLSACSNDSNSPEAWAKKFCNCSKDMSEAVVKLKSGKISIKEFEESKHAQQQCMGPTDPRQSMNEPELIAFDSVFYKTLFKECPKVAKNYGFVE